MLETVGHACQMRDGTLPRRFYHEAYWIHGHPNWSERHAVKCRGFVAELVTGVTLWGGTGLNIYL